MNKTEQHEQIVLEHLAICERVRKKLELPLDALTLISQLLQQQTFQTPPWNERNPLPSYPDDAEVALRTPLRLISEKKIQRTDPLTGKATAVIVRPQTIAMRVEEIEILSSPDEWVIADIQVGCRSQFPQLGPPTPGRLFTPGGTCHHFVTETIQTAMDFTMLVHYVGTDPEGSIFKAVAMGKAARY